MILDSDQPVFQIKFLSFGLICIFLASLCPILLAYKIKKLAIYIRLIKKVLQKILALFLIYSNIVTLFKNLLVYLLHKKNPIFQQIGAGYLSAFSKTIAMMTGELTYEETFTGH